MFRKFRSQMLSGGSITTKARIFALAFMQILSCLCFGEISGAASGEISEAKDSPTSYSLEGIPLPFNAKWVGENIELMMSVDKGQSFVSEMLRRGSLNSKGVIAVAYLGTFYWKKNEYDMAKRYMLEVRKRRKDFEDTKLETFVYWVLAECAFIEHDYESRLKYLKEIYEIYPDFPFTLPDMADSCYHLKRYEEGLGYIDQAIKLEPETVKHHRVKIYLLLYAHKQGEAIAYARRIIDSDRVKFAPLLNDLATIYSVRDCPIESMRFSREFLDIVERNGLEAVDYIEEAKEQLSAMGTRLRAMIVNALSVAVFMWFIVLLAIKKDRSDTSLLIKYALGFTLLCSVCPLLIRLALPSLVASDGFALNNFLLIRDLLLLSSFLCFLFFLRHKIPFKNPSPRRTKNYPLLFLSVFLVMFVPKLVGLFYQYHVVVERGLLEAYRLRYPRQQWMSGTDSVFLAIRAIVCWPVIEELILRVSLVTVVLKRFSLASYVVIGALLFTFWEGVCSGGVIGSLLVFIIGASLCFLYRFSRTVLPIILLHALMNLCMVMFKFFLR